MRGEAPEELEEADEAEEEVAVVGLSKCHAGFFWQKSHIVPLSVQAAHTIFLEQPEQAAAPLEDLALPQAGHGSLPSAGPAGGGWSSPWSRAQRGLCIGEVWE